MVLFVAWDPGPVLPGIVLEQDTTRGLTEGYTSPCPSAYLGLLPCRSGHKHCPHHPCSLLYPRKRSLEPSYTENISCSNA